MKSFSYSVVVSILFLSSIAQAGFFLPRIEPVPQAGSDLVISVNFSGVAVPRLYFRDVDDSGWFVFNVSLVNGSCTIPAFYFSEGLYEYYFADESGSSRFPDANATFRIGLSRGNVAIYDKAKKLINSDPATHCAPWNSDYSCDYENMQGFMISAFNDAFLITGNMTFENKSDRLAENQIDEVDPLNPYETCDHAKNDFDCENRDDNDPNPESAPSVGAMRQASMMHALWNRYRLGGNSTVRELAVNYTSGSAENCDVWNVTPDYDCGSGNDQGFMMYSFFEAYELTGDVNYKQIARNLTSYGLNYSNSDFLMLGFFKAYELTGNESYRSKAVNLSLGRLDVCRYGGCDVYNQSISAFAMWIAYEQTGDYRYKLSAYDKTMHNFSGSCNPWNDTFSCQDPLEQGAIAEAFFKGYQILEAGNATFYSHSVSDSPGVSQPVTINVSFGGILRSPSLWYKRVGYSSWGSGAVSLQEKSYIIPSSHVQNAGVYEYYFYDNDSGARYPENGGTFKLALSSGNDTFRMIARNFSDSDPTKNLCRPFSNDFSCDYETQQGPMIYGYSSAYFSSDILNYSIIAANFSINEIDETDAIPMFGEDQWATCDHSDGDFDCSNDSVDDSPLGDVSAPLRQGWMIYSLWDAYQKTRDSAIKKVALDYSFGSSEMCDVWNSTPDYDCENSDEQGLMMLAYFKAYEQSGNGVFRRIAENLSFVGVDMNDSDYLTMGLFSAFDMTGNSTYYDKAINISNSRKDYCVESGCSALNLSLSALSAWAAYEHTETQFYLDMAVNKTLQSPVGSCDPWDSVPDYQCEYPDEQGTMMRLYWMADQAYTSSLSYVSLNVSLGVSSDSVYVGDSFNVSCFVENTGSAVLFNVTVALNYSFGGLNTSDNLSYFYDNLSVLENKTLNWTLVGIGSGTHFVSCNVTTDVVNGSDYEFVVVNTVDDKLPDNPAGSGSSTVVSDDSEYVFYEESYSYFDLNNSGHFFDLISDDRLLADSIRENLGVDDDFAEVSETSYDIAGCYNVSRIFESNSSCSKISLSILYFCSNTTESLLVYDTIPEVFADSSEGVYVELSRDGDVFVLDDSLSYLFIFNNVSQNELIYINYTVNGSILYNLLDSIERPYLFGDRFEENASDVVAPLITIVFPINNSNVASTIFDLWVRYYDESDVLCEYSLDDTGPLEMEDYMLSEKFSTVNASSGNHSILVECVDLFGNRNSSLVVFYVDVANEDVISVNDSSLAMEWDMWLAKNGLFIFNFLLIMILLALMFYYLYLNGYISYFLLCGLLGVMYLFDRAGGVCYSLKFYPVMLKLYESLDANVKLKKSLYLHEDISKVVRVLELYTVTNKMYDSVVKNDVDRGRLWHSLVYIKKLYDEVMSESLAGVEFLEQVRKKYIYCANYLTDGMQGASDSL